MIWRLRSLTPDAAIRLIPKALIATGLVSPVLIFAIARLTYPTTQVYSPYFADVFSWSALAVIAGGLLAAGAPASGPPSRRVDPNGVVSFALAIAIGILLLVVPVFLLVWRTSYDDITGWTYPFLNKRWLGALYGILLVTVFVLPAAIWRLRDSWSFEPVETAAVSGKGSLLLRMAGLAAVVLLVWLAAGPPWHLERHHRPIDFHEQVHLGPLQAIAKGHTAFVGAASTQYGPGTQLLTYGYMTRRDRFTVVGYREANLVFHFAAALAVGLFAWWLLTPIEAVLVIVLAFAYSPLSFFAVTGDGTFQGAYGWGNAFRYLGALLVVPSAGLLALRRRARLLFDAFVLLGVVWGFFSWVSQENLSSTVTSGGLLFVLLVLTRTISLPQAITVAVNLVVGWLAWWIPVLIVYALNGELGAFVGNYFRVARAVAAGFSNSLWLEPTDTPYYRVFVWTPWVIAVIGMVTLWKLPLLRLRSPLTHAQVRLLGFLCVLAACYATALYRSDGSHLMNTMIALPFVITLTIADLPHWLTTPSAGRMVLRIAAAILLVLVYPVAPLVTDLYRGLVKPSLVRFGPLPDLPPAPHDDRVAFQRATAYLRDEPTAVPGTVPMRQLLEEISGVRDVVGNRRTLLGGMGSVYTGLVYFMADLTPARMLLERETMTINPVIGREVLEDLRRHIDQVDCVMVREIDAPEAVIFREAYPNARVEQRMLAGAPVFILLRPA